MEFNDKTGKLQANTNMYIAKKDLSEVYGNCIYLGIYDDEHNYTEVDESEKNFILNKIEEQRKLEEKEHEKQRGEL